MNELVGVDSAGRLPSLVRELSATVAAIFTASGELLDANRGFKRLMERAGGSLDSTGLRALFVNPDFAVLTSAAPPEPGAPVFRGLLTLGSVTGGTRSLRAEVYRAGERLLLVAEHDVTELEEVSSQILKLNDELAETQRSLIRTNRELRQNEAVVRELANTDALTRAANRRHFDERYSDELLLANAEGHRLILIIADVDHFKQINDAYGHETGDRVLSEIARVLRESVLGSDFVARYGGEEFALLFTDTPIEKVRNVVMRIRTRLAALSISPLEQPVTLSFGIAEFRRGENGSDLLRRADAAMYRAKHEGRDRVVVATGD